MAAGTVSNTLNYWDATRGVKMPRVAICRFNKPHMNLIEILVNVWVYFLREGQQMGLQIQ